MIIIYVNNQYPFLDQEKDSATNCENPSECATPGGDNGEAKPDAKQKKERKPTRRQERKQRITLKKEEAANKVRQLFFLFGCVSPLNESCLDMSSSATW